MSDPLDDGRPRFRLTPVSSKTHRTSGDRSVNGREPVRIEVADTPVPDHQTVTPDGARLTTEIDGVRVRRAMTHTDERGSLCEIYDPRWGFSEEPLVYAYAVTIPPGQKRGWVVHREQDDRLFLNRGSVKVVLYDARGSSPTQGVVQELFFGEFDRVLLRIPAGVFHAVVNIGTATVDFVNMPTRPYRHEQPDKYRLPEDTPAIPYSL
jgi:dTDP-4-dehydrorhamnose 3,5-epimerase